MSYKIYCDGSVKHDKKIGKVGLLSFCVVYKNMKIYTLGKYYSESELPVMDVAYLESEAIKRAYSWCLEHLRKGDNVLILSDAQGVVHGIKNLKKNIATGLKHEYLTPQYESIQLLQYRLYNKGIEYGLNHIPRKRNTAPHDYCNTLYQSLQ